MATTKILQKGVRELRFILCQSSAASSGVRYVSH